MIKLCTLYSGSSGNSTFLSCGDENILIDAGMSGKSIEKALESIDVAADSISALFITHEHIDHMKGAGVLSRRYNIPIYASKGTWDSVGTDLGKISEENIRIFKTGEKINIGNAVIQSFSIPHDAGDPVGYSIYYNQKKVTVATDIGYISRDLLDNLMGSNMLLIESNHDVEMLKVGSYPWSLKQRILSKTGHLCNEMAGKVVAYLAEHGTAQFLLGHLSKENNFPELAYQTVKNALEEKKIYPDKDVFLEVARRDRTSSMIQVV